MEINAVSSRRTEAPPRDGALGKGKEAFQTLGKALDTGDLASAKSALDQLQKNAPPASARKDPGLLEAKMNALTQAVDSGDVKASQTAYAELKKAAAQGAGGGRAQRGAGGPPPTSGAPQGASGASTKASEAPVLSVETFDVKDTNQNGTVSPDEEMAYVIKQSKERVKHLRPADRHAIDTWA